MIKREILLNPGPATTTDSVKMAQVVPDICPREKEFGELMDSISKDLIKIVNGNENYDCVLFGGSGTAGIEAVISSVVPTQKKLLVVNNGAYGERIVNIAKTYGISYSEQKEEWGDVPDLKKLEKKLREDSEIEVVSAIHHETTTGILNPILEIGKISKKYRKVFVVDAVSSFAGIPLDIKRNNIDFMVSTSNKCIQGMPGVAFVIAKKEELEKTKDYGKSFYLNLYNQYIYLKEHNQMRFTPPVQTIYALRKAIDEFFEEGGIGARNQRYREIWRILVNGMESFGFKRYKPEVPQSHLLTTFYEPEHSNYSFEKLHNLLKEKGFTIYPGKIQEKTFRLANIGAIDSKDINNFLESMKITLKEMDLITI